MILNLYAFREDVKARLALPDTTDDAIIDQVLYDVSREVDAYCNRRFWAGLETRYFGAIASCGVRVDDLLSVTSLKTDEDLDRVYETTWSTTDYDLEPVNAPLESPPRPYSQILTTPNGRYSFPCQRRAVQVAGLFGGFDVRQASGATLAEDLDTSETVLDVSASAPFRVGQIVIVDEERMEISAVTANDDPTPDTITVTRAVNGTAAATHTSGAVLYTAAYPIVSEAVMHQVTLEFAAKNSPLGQVGGSEFGQAVRAQYEIGLHPFTKRKLMPLRLRKVG